MILSVCPIRGLEAETMGHILWSCPMARDAWSICGRKLQKSCAVNDEFIHVVEVLQNKLEDDDIELMALVARNLWFRRNSMILGGLFGQPAQLVRKAMKSLDAFKNGNTKTQDKRESGNSFTQKWSMSNVLRRSTGM